MGGSMSLKGGLIIDNFGKVIDYADRYAGGAKPYERKVMFLNRNGYGLEMAEAQKYFSEGDVLTVNEIYVGSFSSYVEFVEVPFIWFNTAMFADVE